MAYCPVRDEKFVRIAMVDGKIRRYRSPLRVRDVLINFSGHGISDTATVNRCLPLDTKLSTEYLYYLVPLPGGNKKKMPEMAARNGNGDGLVRINRVIRKKKLENPNSKLEEGVSTEEILTVQIELEKIVVVALITVMVIGMMVVVRDDKFVRIEMVDGKIRRYRSPLRVRDVLINFSGHGISDTAPVYRCLPPDTKLSTEYLYYLVPLPAGNKKKMPEMAARNGNGDGLVRINGIIRKKKLENLNSKLEEGVSTEEILTVQIELEKIVVVAVVVAVIAAMVMGMMGVVLIIPHIFKLWGQV